MQFVNQDKPYLLDPNVLVDIPVPIFTFSQILKDKYLVFFLFCIIICGLALFFIFKKKQKVEKESEIIEEQIDPYAAALDQLNQLITASPKLAPKPFIFQLSAILRLYVERQFQLPALEQTGEEFLHEVSSHPLLKKKFQSTLSDFVSQSDLIKYSPKEFTYNELEILHHCAEQFINEAQSEFNARTSYENQVLDAKPDLSAK